MKRLVYILLLVLHFAAYAQQPLNLADSIAMRIENAAMQQPEATLFVHFDKTIYANNENAWFTAYLVKTNFSAVHHTLSVALIQTETRSVFATAKYVMDNGLAFGNMVLPDSLPTGNYSFVCYTNQLANGKPSALFVQPVTIKAGDDKSFIATLSLADSIKPGMDSARVMLRAYKKDAAYVKAAAVNYFIGDKLHPFYSGSLTTDKFGEAFIPIPLNKITPGNNVLVAEIDNGKEVKYFSTKLPVYNKKTLVKFYPEGGELVDNVKSVVGWEVTDNEGEPLQVSASLYKDDKPIQNITTGIYGMGKFVFTAEAGSRYHVKLQSPATDSLYMLPRSLQNGLVITMPDALTADTAFASINTEGIAGKFILMVHDYRNVYIDAPVFTMGKPMLLKIPLQDVPKGITSLTIADSLGRPLAERLFFAHFDKKAIVNIKIDSLIYKPRQKVSAKIKITTAGNQPLPSLVSVACVQNNRFDLAKTMTIENYVYLTNELSSFVVKKDMMSDAPENKIFLETLLLVKGWRRYTWQNVQQHKSADTAVMNSLSFTGKVLYIKKIKKPLQLNLKKFISPKLAELEYLYTDSAGIFELSADKITSEPGRKFEVSVNNERKEEYIITVTDPYTTISKTLAASLAFPDHTIRSFAQSSQAFVLKNGEVAKTLKTVVITSNKDETMFSTRVSGPNICGDYVCPYGILNCTNHLNEGFEPVVGRTYSERMGMGNNNMIKRLYQGCIALTEPKNKEYKFTMEGIYYKKEFYVADLAKADISDPQYLSTLYWNYALATDKNGEAALSFYTGDIPGKFRIVVQGVATNNVVYGEYYFDVSGQ
jgi:hypothetical protein